MSKGRFKYLLVLLNLLALNAYALASVAVDDASAASSHMSMHHAQGDMSHDMAHDMNGMHHPQHDCEMPCCKDKGKDKQQATLHHHGNNCACKSGICGVMQLQSIATPYLHSKINTSCKVDAMSTTVPAQNMMQRMLRPPIH